MPDQNRSVFVVHGRNMKARDAMNEFLDALKLHPIKWSEAVHATGKTAPYIGQILDAGFAMASAVVVLFTPDDDVRLRSEWHEDREPPHETTVSGQARPNVLFEAGFAMGLHEDRTVLVEFGELRPFSDIAGRHVVRVDGSEDWRQDLANRLHTAGCLVNLEGKWRTAGDFASALSASRPPDSASPKVYASTHADAEALPDLSRCAAEMLRRAAESKGGGMLRQQMFGGLVIKAGGVAFDTSNPRKEALWDSALDELDGLGLVKQKGEKMWTVTNKGYAWVDRAAAKKPARRVDEPCIE